MYHLRSEILETFSIAQISNIKWYMYHLRFQILATFSIAKISNLKWYTSPAANSLTRDSVKQPAVTRLLSAADWA